MGLSSGGCCWDLVPALYPLISHLPRPLSCFILPCLMGHCLYCRSFDLSPPLTSRAAISLSLDKEAVIVHVILVADMRILVFCLFHIHFYHTPTSPAFPHPCPLAGSSHTVAGEQKPKPQGQHQGQHDRKDRIAKTGVLTLLPSTLPPCCPSSQPSTLLLWCRCTGMLSPWRTIWHRPPSTSGLCLHVSLSVRAAPTTLKCHAGTLYYVTGFT